MPPKKKKGGKKKGKDGIFYIIINIQTKAIANAKPKARQWQCQCQYNNSTRMPAQWAVLMAVAMTMS